MWIYRKCEKQFQPSSGIRDDNRLKNLELWTRPQPAGIRVKDAIRWAKEILKRYEAEIGRLEGEVKSLIEIYEPGNWK